MAMDFHDAFNPFRALRHGVAALKRDPPTVLVGGLLLMIMSSCQGGGGNFRMPSDGGGMSKEMAAVALGAALVGCCIGLAVFLARGFIEPGIWRAGARITEEGVGGMDTLFSGKDAWLSMLGYMLIRTLIGLGVFIVTALPGGLLLGLAFYKGGGGEPNLPLAIAGGALMLLIVAPVMIYVQLGLQLGNLAVAIDDCKAMEALDRSWNLARGNRLQLLVFDIVNGLLVFVGFLACCIGAIPAYGVVFSATSNAYLLHTRDDFEDFVLVQEEGAY